MKSGWAIKKLGEVCDRIVDGDHNPPLGIERSDYLMLSSKNILDGFLNFDNPRYLSKNDFELTTQRTNVCNGDVLLTIVGTIGRCCVFTGDRPVALQRSVAVLKPRNGLVESRFLMFSLQSLSRVLEEKGHGAAQKGLYLRELATVEIPVPPLPEQKRIVAKIDAAFEKIGKLKANAERNLANAKELFQSALDEAMRPKKGWVEKRLGEVGACKNGLNFKRVSVGGSIDIVGVGDFKKGLFVEDTTSLERLTLDKLPEQDWYLQPNDIVFVRSNGSKVLVGRAVIVKTRRLLTFSGFCIRYRIEDKNVNADFLARIVSSERFRKKMLVGRNASTINNVTQPILLAQVIGLPSLVEQKQIVKRLDSLSEKVKLLEQHYTRQIADCAEMRQSVLREAFEGRL